MHGLVRQCGDATVEIDGSGRVELSASLGLGDAATSASLRLSGSLNAVADAALQLSMDSVCVDFPPCNEGEVDDAAALVAACADAIPGLEFVRHATSPSSWVAATQLPPLRLSQLYLDQDTHIVQLELAEIPEQLEMQAAGPMVLRRVERAPAASGA